MFAGVNIKKTTPSSENATGSFDAMVTTLGKTQPKVAAMWNESMSYVANNTFAAAWGKDLDTSELEAWAVMPFIQNVLETRMGQSKLVCLLPCQRFPSDLRRSRSRSHRLRRQPRRST